ncbi:MAG TPA: MarR family transcriptional regulator [Ruminiclostridium sp.]|nr:MarR family transcriptional regulator [Ruminiclostridium sp.]
MEDENHSIGRWISILYRYRQSYINRKLESYNIGSGQHIVLMYLQNNGGVRQEEMSEYLKIDKGSIAKSVKKLEEEGYVKRLVDAEDKRAYKVYLTQKAQEVMPAVLEAIKSWEDAMVSELSNEEVEVIDDKLKKMAQKAFEIKTK